MQWNLFLLVVTSTDFKNFNDGGDAAKKSSESPYCKFKYGNGNWPALLWENGIL